jgi:hypothetical protein
VTICIIGTVDTETLFRRKLGSLVVFKEQYHTTNFCGIFYASNVLAGCGGVVCHGVSDWGNKTVNWLKYRKYWMVAGVILSLPVMAQGQTRLDSVIVTANVSEVVAISVSPNSSQDNLRIEAQSDVNVLTLTLSGSGTDVVAARVPILIRSNTGYKITGLVQSQTAKLASFAVLDARLTGRFAAPDAIENLDVVLELDSRTTNRTIQTASLPLGLSSPLAILNGPRVSLAGTLNSADNALEVTLLITVKPDAGADKWLLRLTLSGSASNRF